MTSTAVMIYCNHDEREGAPGGMCRYTKEPGERETL